MKGDEIKCVVWFLRQLWFHSVLQPDLYMTVPLHLLGISAEEVGWLLCPVEGDLVCCRVNGFPFRCGVCPNCCLCLLDCSGNSPRLGRGEGRDTEVWRCSLSTNQFTAGATAPTLLRDVKTSKVLCFGTSEDTWFHRGKLATTVMCNAVWPDAVRWHHMVNETGSCGMCGHLLLQLGGWLAASQADY